MSISTKSRPVVSKDLLKYQQKIKPAMIKDILGVIQTTGRSYKIYISFEVVYTLATVTANSIDVQGTTLSYSHTTNSNNVMRSATSESRVGSD